MIKVIKIYHNNGDAMIKLKTKTKMMKIIKVKINKQQIKMDVLKL